MNKTLTSVKMFAHKHKTAICVTATIVVAFAIQKRAMDHVNEFLEEEGLLEKFYCELEEV